MPSGKELKDRMKSIRDTRKITNAMYLISSSKLQQARRSLKATEPYFFTFQKTMEDLLAHAGDLEHRYFEEREHRGAKPEKALLVITADKGLAGGYNSMVLKLAQELLGREEKTRLFVVGEVGRHYFLRRGIPIAEHFQYTAQDPTMNRARRIAQTVLSLYDCGQVSEIHIVYTKIMTGMTYEAVSTRLLPMKKERYQAEGRLPRSGDNLVLYPSPAELLENLIPNYVTGFLYGALVESFASEQSARMLAMQTATKNADDMLHGISVQFNRIRQAAITQEITEIVSGARALQQHHEGGTNGYSVEKLI